MELSLRRRGRNVIQAACMLLVGFVACGLLLVSEARAQEYQLTIGDIIEFDILDDDEALRKLTIAQDGQVQVPLLGTVTIAGLTVPDAIDKLRQRYIDGQLLRDPKIALAIASFRPVFVLGDVDNPGLVEYRALMTVEQAVGLAGGLTRVTSSGDEQLLTEATLRGELKVLSAEIARQAAVLARLQAQRTGAVTLSIESVPDGVRDILDISRFEALLPIETTILETDRDSLAAEEAALRAQIDALEREVALLDERESNERDRIAAAQAERDRIAKLVDRGALASARLTEADQALATVRSPLIEAARDKTEAERQLADLGQRLATLSSSTAREILVSIQNTDLELQRLLARRVSTEERIFLVTTWQSERTQEAFSVETVYRVRRMRDGVLTTETASLIDLLLPGDVVLVSIDLPG